MSIQQWQVDMLIHRICALEVLYEALQEKFKKLEAGRLDYHHDEDWYSYDPNE